MAQIEKLHERNTYCERNVTKESIMSNCTHVGIFREKFSRICILFHQLTSLWSMSLQSYYGGVPWASWCIKAEANHLRIQQFLRIAWYVHRSSRFLTSCKGNPPVADGCYSQQAINEKGLAMSWFHHVLLRQIGVSCIPYWWSGAPFTNMV